MQKIVDLLRQTEALMPFLLTLSPDESRGLRNIGFDGIPFAQAALDAVRADVNFTRRSFDLPEFEKDVALLAALRGVLAVLAPLTQKVSDTLRITGADTMVTADDVYEDLRKDNGETAAVQAPLQIMRKRRQGPPRRVAGHYHVVQNHFRVVRNQSETVRNRSGVVPNRSRVVRNWSELVGGDVATALRAPRRLPRAARRRGRG